MSKRTKHNGITSYTTDEADNINIAQGGFDLLEGIADAQGMEHVAGKGFNSATRTYYPDVEYWIAMKAVSHGAVKDSSVIAKSIVGDDLMLRAVRGYEFSVILSGDNVDLQADDIIVGCFSKIRICDAISYIQAYRG